MFAEQAGVDGMGYPWDGDWCDEDASDYDEEYLPSHREDVLFDLEDGGPWGARPRRPTAAELAPLAWPHSCWWHDRDRIVLLTCTCSTTRLMAASFGRLACASRCTLSGQTAGTAPARRSAMSDRDD